VIQAAIADGLECAIKDGSEVLAVVVGRRRTVPGWGAAGQEEEEPRCFWLRHWWQRKFVRSEREKEEGFWFWKKVGVRVLHFLFFRFFFQLKCYPLTCLSYFSRLLISHFYYSNCY